MSRSRLLPLFIVLVVAVATFSAHATRCDAETLWSLCRQDRTCAWLFRKDGVDGVASALAYFDAVSQRSGGGANVPWPAAWADVMRPERVFGAAACFDVAGASYATGGANASADAVLAVAVLTQLRGVMAAGEHGCVDPYEYPVYDSVTAQYACVCAEGHVCSTSDDATAAALSTNYVLLIVTLSLVGAVMLAALVAAPVMLGRATAAVLELSRRPLPAAGELH